MRNSKERAKGCVKAGLWTNDYLVTVREKQTGALTFRLAPIEHCSMWVQEPPSSEPNTLTYRSGFILSTKTNRRCYSSHTILANGDPKAK
jgi:hypothetical protein